MDGWERREDVKNDFNVVPFPEGDNSPRLVSFVVNSTVPSSGRAYTMYVGLLRNGLPDSFSLELPTGGVSAIVTCFSCTCTSTIHVCGHVQHYALTSRLLSS